MGIVLIDDESFRWIVGAFGALVVLLVVTIPSRPRLRETTWGKIFAGMAIALVVAFVLFVWFYGRAR